MRIAVKQHWFAAAKMRDPRTPDCFWETPITIGTILFQFVHAMMSAYMLQIGHDNLEFFALSHRMDKIVQHSHFTPGKQTGRLPGPALNFIPHVKRDCLPPAGKGSRTEIGVPPPFEVRIKPAQLHRVKVKMRQPCRD